MGPFCGAAHSQGHLSPSLPSPASRLALAICIYIYMHIYIYLIYVYKNTYTYLIAVFYLIRVCTIVGSKVLKLPVGKALKDRLQPLPSGGNETWTKLS